MQTTETVRGSNKDTSIENPFFVADAVDEKPYPIQSARPTRSSMPFTLWESMHYLVRSDVGHVSWDFHVDTISQSQNAIIEANPYWQDMTLENDVIREFIDIPEVKRITFSFEENFQVFHIYTPNKKYDDKLMDRLIDKQIILMDRFPNNRFGFCHEIFSASDNKESQACPGEVIIYQI